MEIGLDSTQVTWLLGLATIVFAILGGIWVVMKYVVEQTKNSLESFMLNKIESFSDHLIGESKRIDSLSNIITKLTNGFSEERISSLKRENEYMKIQDDLKTRVNSLEERYDDLKKGQKELTGIMDKIDKNTMEIRGEMKILMKSNGDDKHKKTS